MRICVDAGHGGSAPGAVGMYGTKEKEITLAVALKLKQTLQARGHTVIMTRSSDISLGLTTRGTISNKALADAFISIHCNSARNKDGSTNRTAHGFEIYTSPGQTRADPLATAIYNAWHEAFPDARLRPDLRDGDPDKENNFTVLTSTKAPAVLVELDFISNPSIEPWLANRHNHAGFARAICAGVENWIERG